MPDRVRPSAPEPEGTEACDFRLLEAVARLNDGPVTHVLHRQPGAHPRIAGIQAGVTGMADDLPQQELDALADSFDRLAAAGYVRKTREDKFVATAAGHAYIHQRRGPLDAAAQTTLKLLGILEPSDTAVRSKGQLPLVAGMLNRAGFDPEQTLALVADLAERGLIQPTTKEHEHKITRAGRSELPARSSQRSAADDF